MYRSRIPCLPLPQRPFVHTCEAVCRAAGGGGAESEGAAVEGKDRCGVHPVHRPWLEGEEKGQKEEEEAEEEEKSAEELEEAQTLKGKAEALKETVKEKAEALKETVKEKAETLKEKPAEAAVDVDEDLE